MNSRKKEDTDVYVRNTKHQTIILKKMSISISRIRREGIDKVKTKGNYSFEFKLSVVKLYLITEASYQEMALSVGINNPAMLSQ